MCHSAFPNERRLSHLLGMWLCDTVGCFPSWNLKSLSEEQGSVVVLAFLLKNKQKKKKNST